MKIQKSCVEAKATTFPTVRAMHHVPVGTVFRCTSGGSLYLRVYDGLVNLADNTYTPLGQCSKELAAYIPLLNAMLVTGEE